MALQITHLTREFVWEGKTLKDPGKHLSPEEVRKHLAANHQLMTTASVTGPEIKEVEGRQVAIYTISKTSGTLG